MTFVFLEKPCSSKYFLLTDYPFKSYIYSTSGQAKNCSDSAVSKKLMVPLTQWSLIQFFFFRSLFSLYTKIYYIISQWSCSASGSLWEIPDSNPGPLPQKSGALPMSHHNFKFLNFYIKNIYYESVVQMRFNHEKTAGLGNGHPFFSKERNALAVFSVLYKRKRRSLRSFPFVIKQRSVLCVLFRSL